MSNRQTPGASSPEIPQEIGTCGIDPFELKGMLPGELRKMCERQGG